MNELASSFPSLSIFCVISLHNYLMYRPNVKIMSFLDMNRCNLCLKVIVRSMGIKEAQTPKHTPFSRNKSFFIQITNFNNSNSVLVQVRQQDKTRSTSTYQVCIGTLLEVGIQCILQLATKGQTLGINVYRIQSKMESCSTRKHPVIREIRALNLSEKLSCPERSEMISLS